MTVEQPKLPEDLESELFRIHFEVPSDERAACLQRLCDANGAFADALRAQYDALQRSERLLGAAHRELDGDAIARSVGGFEIERVLGQGGFGTVYLAHQRRPVERRVALKVLHAHRADAVARRRFEVERQLLARLQHSCIAQVYDAGVSDDGQSFFAMELVEGLPITDWCRRDRLDVDRRLQLFQRVCAGIHYAHQREVVHRDLKPSNVLVTEQDGEPMPKVIDFGIAKLMTHGTTAHDVTLEGARVGTPGYMSPEQAAGESVGSGTDVYSLGVLLCELLTGRPLHPAEDFSGKGFAEIARMLAQPPARRPSELLEPAVAAREPALLRRLQTDLDWIVLRAAAPRAEERYASVAALAEDVERHLRGEPVQARRQATFYVVGKFVRRHRVAVAIAGMVAVLLVAAVLLLGWSLDVVGDARVQAERERDAAQASDAAARIVVAQFALESGDVRTAADFLAGVPEARRGWEWRHLADRVEGSLARVPLDMPYLEMGWIDDARVLLFSFHGQVRVWNVETAEAERSFEGWQGILRRGLVDAPSRRALILGDRGFSLWDVDLGASVREFGVPPGEPFALAWSPDRRFAAAAGRGRWLHVVDVTGDGEGAQLPVEQNVTAIAFLGRDELVVGTEDGVIQRLRRSDGAVLATLEGHTDIVEAILVDERRGLLYSASIEGTVRVWDLHDGRPRARLVCNVGMRRLELSEDGARLYGCGGWSDGRLLAWETETFQLLGRYFGHGSGVGALALHPDGRRLASISRDQSLRVWSTDPPRDVQVLDAGLDARSLAIDEAGARFATASFDGRLRVWDAATLEPCLDLQTESTFTGAALRADVVYAAGRGIRAFSVADGELLGESPSSGHRIENLCLDASGRWLLGGFREHLMIWELPGLALRHDLQLPSIVTSRAWDEAAGAFVIGGADGCMRWLEPSAGAVVRTRRVGDAEDGVRTMASSGARRVFGVGGSLHIEGFDGGERVISVPNSCAAISPDGLRIATGAPAHEVRLLDPASGAQLLVFRDLIYSIREVQFVAAGSRLVALAHRWEAPSSIYCWYAPDVAVLPSIEDGR